LNSDKPQADAAAGHDSPVAAGDQAAQLSRFELLEAVQQELLENPMLEEGVKEISEEHEIQAPTVERPESVSFEDAELMRNADWENYLGDFSSTAKQVQFKETEALEEMMSYEARLSGKPLWTAICCGSSVCPTSPRKRK
jgi:RNA polymerase, sigma 54 subunit, RpoN/SigL